MRRQKIEDLLKFSWKSFQSSGEFAHISEFSLSFSIFFVIVGSVEFWISSRGNRFSSSLGDFFLNYLKGEEEKQEKCLQWKCIVMGTNRIRAQSINFKAIWIACESAYVKHGETSETCFTRVNIFFPLKIYERISCEDSWRMKFMLTRRFRCKSTSQSTCLTTHAIQLIF